MSAENPPLFRIEGLVPPGCVELVTSLTLHDLFAAFALAGLEANPNHDFTAEEVAKFADLDADAMLERRAQK